MINEPFFTKYTRLVSETDVLKTMRMQLVQPLARLDRVSVEESSKLHDPYTWTLKQVILHISDTERIFAYRALRFIRGDKTELPGFDQDAYVAIVDLSELSMDNLLEELRAVRLASVHLFANVPSDAWSRTGVASGLTWSVDDIARAIIGHARHHIQIIEKRLGENL